jgi:hypothetical protein
MKKVAAQLVSLAFLFAPAGLLAQDDPPPTLSSASALDSPALSLAVDSTPAATTPAPLTLPQKYTYSLKQIFDPARLLLFGIRAGIDQATGTPGAWGGGTASFGIRTASHFGSGFVRENIAFGIAAMDHEERRYFRLGESSSGWTRTRHAVRHAFIVQNERGGMMPAYSNFIADLGTPFIAQQWRPGGIKGMRELRGGSISLGVDAASNLWREFLPDFAKRRQHGRPQTDQTIAQP